MEKRLPDEIMIEILSWLPVKSLLMFKTVSKLWHSIISSQFLAEKHARNQMIKCYEDNDDIIIRDQSEMDVPKTLSERFRTCTRTWRRLLKKNPPCYHRRDRMRDGCLIISRDRRYVSSLFKYYGNNESKKSLVFKKGYRVVNCPFLEDQHSDIRRIGSCNGLICIHTRNDDIALWNPAIGDSKVVPPSQLQRPATNRDLGREVGFGFDSCTNDYKVIQLFFRIDERSGLVCHMEVYSLKTNSWRKYDHSTIPARFKEVCGMVHKNEIFCWSGAYTDVENGKEDVVIWFDMRDEVFRTKPSPKHTLQLSWVDVYIFSLHGSIALVFFGYEDAFSYEAFEIWSIKDLQEKESWTKLTNIGPLPGWTIWQPLGFWNNGQFMILRTVHHGWVFYDFRLRKVVSAEFQGCTSVLDFFSDLILYVETLVAVSGYSNV